MIKKSRFCMSALLSLVLFLALCTSAFAATAGQQLPTPEDGWQRIDDTNPGITYTGVWNGYTDSTRGAGQWNTSYHSTAVYGSNNSTQAGGSLKFSFVGTKFRWIAYSNASCSKENTIKVDGQVVATNVNSAIANTAVGKLMVLIYEKTDLSLGLHTVEITANTTAQLIVDAFDIDSTGYVIGNISAPSVTATSNENSRAPLNWTSVSNATKYNIKRSSTSGGPYTTMVATNVTGTTYTDINVTNGVTYYYIVTAANDYEESPPSIEASATPQGPVVQPETGRAILTITMDTGIEKEYDLSMAEINSFISWYEAKASGTGTASFAIDKHDNNKGPFKNRKDYIIFDKILTFQVNEYEVVE